MKKAKDFDFRICTYDDNVVDTVDNCIYIQAAENLIDARPLQRLWQAVVLTAFQDALSSSQKISAQVDKRRAITWLLRSYKDFYEVCGHAGLDPEMIREKAKKLLL